MRDMKAYIGGLAEAGGHTLGGRLQQYGRNGAIHVVVAIDQDGFASRQSGAETHHRPVHAEHPQGIVQGFKCWIKE
jgi:hypothetical protein